MMGPTAPMIHLGLGRRGSVSDRQVFLSSHTNPSPSPSAQRPAGLNSMLTLRLLMAATLSVGTVRYNAQREHPV